MTHLEFRRNQTKDTKQKRLDRISQGILFNGNLSKNYLSILNQDKQNKDETFNRIKKDTQGLINKRYQNTFSLNKQKRVTLQERQLFKNIDRTGNQFQDFETKQKYLDKKQRIDKINMFKSRIQDYNNIEQENQKNLPYFIECFHKKNKISVQAYMNVHLSLITFKTYRRAVNFAKVKNPDNKIPSQIPNRKTIIFDMDETLIHTNELITPGYQIKVPFKSINGRILYGYVCVRPYAKEILKKLSQFFDIFIFTAGSQSYADPILDHIDPDKVIKHRLYRDSCTLIDGQVFIKDLRILGRKLENVVIVDNAPHTYMMQIHNGIPILPYYKGKDDKQLISLERYLLSLKDVDDVRKVNAQTFQLDQYIKYQSRQSIVLDLYSKFLCP